LKLNVIFIDEIAAVYLTAPILFAILPQTLIDAVAEGSELSGRCRIRQLDERPAIVKHPMDGPAGPDVNSRV